MLKTCFLVEKTFVRAEKGWKKGMNCNKFAGLYIHIPFCIAKCKYCDFYSLPNSKLLFTDYCNRIVEAFNFYDARYERSYNSLYFGGGTPLYFGTENLCTILDNVKVHLTTDAEATAEGNPEQAQETDFSRLKECGINRLSFGLQSSNKRELKALGRRHSSDDAAKAVSLARKAGIDNISLDLMIGIPYQTEESLSESIRFCANQKVKHISAYMLKIEENTPLATSDLRKYCADDDKAADLYLFAVDELKKYGYQQYEISNFAFPGYESKHNLKYWKCEEYLGLGPAAHSYLDKRRFYFDRNIMDFLNIPFSENEKFESDGGGWEEYAMLRLRLTEGLNLKEMKKIYPNILTDQLLDRASKYEKIGLLKIQDDTISYLPEGFLLSNSLTANIIYG